MADTLNEVEVHEHLAELVGARIVALAINGSELARRAGVSHSYIHMMTAGVEKTYRRMDAAKVARALGWTDDSIDRILNGGEPELAFDRSEVTSGGKAITGLSEHEWAVLEATLLALRKTDN